MVYQFALIGGGILVMVISIIACFLLMRAKAYSWFPIALLTVGLIGGTVMIMFGLYLVLTSVAEVAVLNLL